VRIGYEVSSLLATRTGIGNYTDQVLRNLLAVASGDEFHAFSSGRQAIDLDGLDKIASHRHLPLPTRLLYQLWSTCARPRVDAWLGGVDVYHATNYFLPPVSAARRVLTIYDLAFLKSPEWFDPRTVAPFAKHIHASAQSADAILTCSESAKRDIVTLLKVDPEKVTVAYGAIDESFAAVPADEARALVEKCYGVAEPYLLFVGTLEPRKNVLGLLRAYAQAANAIPHALVLVGQAGAAYEAEVERTIDELGIRDRVHRIGYVADRADLPACYSGATAFILPSFDEGFGLPVLEAMACGTPVIASDRASLPEVGGEAARYVSPDDVEALAQAMEEVATDVGLQDRMRDLGHVQRKKFSWAESAARTLDVYHRVVG
jgi:glycosyltransferase involved in cell wall biosynthesis